MKYYLLDYENVNASGLDGIGELTSDCRIVLFYTKNSSKIDLGLFNMKRIPGVDPITYMMGRYMPLSRKSEGTDLAAGFRELMGILPAEDAEPEGTKPEERGLPGSVTVPAALKAAGLNLFSAGRGQADGHHVQIRRENA